MLWRIKREFYNIGLKALGDQLICYRHSQAVFYHGKGDERLVCRLGDRWIEAKPLK